MRLINSNLSPLLLVSEILRFSAENSHLTHIHMFSLDEIGASNSQDSRLYLAYVKYCMCVPLITFKVLQPMAMVAQCFRQTTLA